MSYSPSFSRRTLLKSLIAAAFAAPGMTLTHAVAESPRTPTTDRTRGLKLGVATITLRDLPVASAAAVLQQLELEYASVFRTHAPFEKGTPEECKAAVEGFRAAGIKVPTTSVVNLSTDESQARKAFENVRACGMTMMTCRPQPDALPMLNRLVNEYGIKLAIHNHGPEDELYPSPYDALKLIEKLDPRIGLCIDVGHTWRAGVDPEEAIRRCAPRLFDLHIKDSLAEVGAKKDIPTEVGRGRIKILPVLQALVELKYDGPVAFEYERMGVNPITGLAECVGYVRGMLAALPA